MNATPLEQLLLLEQSGELSPKQRSALSAELAASESARQRRDELLGLAQAIPVPDAQPSPDAVSKITARLQPTRQPALTFVPAWKPVLAAAAALALLLGVRSLQDKPTASPAEIAAVATATEEDEWADPLEAEFTELESLLASISSDDFLEITEL